LIQGYYGTPSYWSFNQLNYINFLQELGIIKKGEETQTRWAPGVSSRPLLQVFAGIKYQLIKGDENVFLQNCYTKKKVFGDVSVYENKNTLPIMFTYDKQITSENFAKLNGTQKDIALLKSCVAGYKLSLDELSVDEISTNYNFNSLAEDVNNRKSNAGNLIRISDSKLKANIALNKEKVVFFSIPFDSRWEVIVDGVEKELLKLNIGFMGIVLPEGEHKIELSYTPPFYYLSWIVSVIASTLFLFMLIKVKLFQSKTSVDNI